MHTVGVGGVMLFTSLWHTAYENRYVTHPLGYNKEYISIYNFLFPFYSKNDFFFSEIFMYTMELMTNDVGYKSFYKKTHLTTLQRDLKEHPIVFTEYSL